MHYAKKHLRKFYPDIFIFQVLFVYLHIEKQRRYSMIEQQNLTQKISQKFFRLK